MKTEDELMAAFEAGTLTQDEQDRFLVGDDFGDKADPLPAETDEEAGKAAPVVEAKTEPEQEPVVLAKDGKHTLPFTVVEELRNDLKLSKDESAQLRQALEEQKGLLEKLAVAQQSDQSTGTTEEVDELVSELAIEFPGAAKIIAGMQKQLADIANRDSQAAETVKRQSEADQNKVAFDSAITAIEPTYPEAVKDPKFWEWFNAQSDEIKASKDSGNEFFVAHVVKLFNNQNSQASDTATDTKRKVQEAMDKASSKSTVQTLSDIPGGASPAADAIEAFHRLPEAAQLAKLMAMSDSDRNKFMDRIL